MNDHLAAAALAEFVALAMAESEGNRDAQQRALGTNYDALGYLALARAALGELERLGLLPGPATTNTATGTLSEPRSDLGTAPGRGVSAT